MKAVPQRSLLFINLYHTTDLEYLWNRNTAVLLYNQLSDHGEPKLFAHMINRYYSSL